MAIISQLQDFPARIPVTRDYFHNWNIRVVNSESITCENYISPNRRDFYKILFIKEGSGLFSLGMDNYHIDGSTILFIHPNEIISWRSVSPSLPKATIVEIHKYCFECAKVTSPILHDL
jgi:AraC family transcriptional activator of pobA